MATASQSSAQTMTGQELRQRLPHQPDIPQKAPSIDTARKVVQELNASESKADKHEQEKKTFGRTPGGTVFTVPETHDMVSQLFSPTEPKNMGDFVVICILAAHFLPMLLLPRRSCIPIYALCFLFWRLSYNGGIGWVLWNQSNYNLLVNWTNKTGIFRNPKTDKNQYPKLYPILKREFETKIPRDYKFDEAPLEYNTWLLFRRVVDVILMCDFISYCSFAYACGGGYPDEHIIMTAARWIIGWALIFFNLWVKLDAHRVVKDFAWYWGDFFFLIDQELTFDGVFEMAPHPMYSIGYAGFYGISLMAASYKVLFISIFGHAAQFAFLAWVESPHIEKTYNPPAPRQPGPNATMPEADMADPSMELSITLSNDPMSPVDNMPGLSSHTQPDYIRDLVGFENFDLHRVSDAAALILQFYIYSLAILTPSTRTFQAFFVLNAAVWRLWYSVGIGYILDRQSKKKSWTRHFIKYGETTEEAWRQWKGVYHLSMTMCYVSFVTAAYKMYSLPPDWEYGMTLLRHVLGTGLILLQLWTQMSIYESLGEFGWFFGDFFYNRGPKLTYSGIYRYLNNPERVIGLAGVWGLAIMTWSKSIFFLALLSHLLTLCFIQFVECPHMQKRYGQRLRQQSGVSKTFERSLPGPLRHWHGSVYKAVDGMADFVDDFVENTRPKLAAFVDRLICDAKTLVSKYPSQMSYTRLAPSLSGYDMKDYKISVEGTPSAAQPVFHKSSAREGDLARRPSFRGSQFQPIILEFGAPIRVKWSAPVNHSKRDWVGLYMLADNGSKEVTRISSQGRWIATTQGIYDHARAEQGIVVNDKQIIVWDDDNAAQAKASSVSSPQSQSDTKPPSSPTLSRRSTGRGTPLMTGELEFSGDKLWWTTGVFEFRYHHDGKHNVMATSAPFEIRIGRFDEEEILGLSAPSQGLAPPTDPTSAGLGNGSASSNANKLRVNSGVDSPNTTANLRRAVEDVLLPVVRNCFDRDPDVAPATVDETFGGLVEREGKFARRVVYAVWQMFGLELAPSVVKADGCVRNLAWRIINAKQVLAPYSMSRSASGAGGLGTPTEESNKPLEG